jgi:hypothetical protein
MKRARYLLLALLGVGVLILAGCLFVPARPTGKIVGYITDAGAGSPVVGAKVTAYPLGDGKPVYWVDSPYFTPTAVTDAEGYYELTVPVGTYVVVAEKEGFATSRVEGVVVASTVKVNIIEKPVFNPDWSLEPPDVTLTIEGQVVRPGDEIVLDAAALADGDIDYRVDAQGANDINIIYAALGKTPGAGWTTGIREAFFSTYTTGDAFLFPDFYGVEGWTTFEVVVYDMNENRTHIICKVYLEPAPGPGSLQPPANPGILAVTLGKKISFYSEPFTVPSGAGDIEIRAAPEGGNLYVELTWDASPDDPVIGGGGITGYRIYRKLSGEADYTLIATVAPGDGVWDPDTWTFLYYFFTDPSPELKAGVEVTYQIRAYMGNTESAPIEISTTPLDIWDVRLLEPADGATDVSLTPTFRWEPTQLVGNDQYYLWVLWDLALGAGYYVTAEFLNETEFEFTGIPGTPYERLQPHRLYQWYIGLAIAYDDFYNPSAVSVAINDWWTADFPYWDMPATDFFTFTTGDW